MKEPAFSEVQTKCESYNHVVLPGKWNVRDAIPERENTKRKRKKIRTRGQ